MEGRMDAVAVLFGNFQMEISKIQELLKEYEVFGTLNQSIANNSPIVMPIIELISRNSNINIQIANDRINIVKPVQIDENGNKVNYNENNFITIVKDIQKKLLSFYGINGNRISYVVNLCKTNQKEIDEIKNKVVSDYFYKSENTFEWSARSAIKEQFSIKGISEEINVITSLNFNPNRLKIVMGKNALEIYGLMYNIDINTSPINIQTRIDAEFIDQFYDQAVSLIKNIEEVY